MNYLISGILQLVISIYLGFALGFEFYSNDKPALELIPFVAIFLIMGISNVMLYFKKDSGNSLLKWSSYGTSMLLTALIILAIAESLFAGGDGFFDGYGELFIAFIAAIIFVIFFILWLIGAIKKLSAGWK